MLGFAVLAWIVGDDLNQRVAPDVRGEDDSRATRSVGEHDRQVLVGDPAVLVEPRVRGRPELERLEPRDIARARREVESHGSRIAVPAELSLR